MAYTQALPMVCSDIPRDIPERDPPRTYVRTHVRTHARTHVRTYVLCENRSTIQSLALMRSAISAPDFQIGLGTMFQLHLRLMCFKYKFATIEKTIKKSESIVL